MSRLKSRGQVLVDLVERKKKVVETGLSSSKTTTEDISNHSQLGNSGTTTDISLPNIDITDQDLQHSLEFQGSRFSELFSDVATGDSESAFSPVVEFIDQPENHQPEPNDILLNPTNISSSTYFPIQLTEEPEKQRVTLNICTTEIEIAERERSTCEDPDFIPTSNNCTETATDHEYSGRPRRGRKRKYPEQNREIRKKKANINQDYVSVTGKVVNCKQFAGNDFSCHCPRKCTEKLSVEQREKEFKKFWSSGSYEARCAILQGSVQEIQKKRTYSVTSNREFSRKYSLAGVGICKKTFLNTMNISQSRIDVALMKFKAQVPINDQRGIKSGGRNAISQERLIQIKQFIDGLPTYTSHYCRDNRTANYLRCDRYKASIMGVTNTEQLELLQKKHKDHLDHAYQLRDQMKSDLARAKTDDKLETLTFDLEKTHCLPRLPTSIVYYKRQLNLHNLGIHSGSSGRGYFYIWLEHEAGRGTQEVGSCIKKFISEHLKPTATELILWADSCGGQNRSIKMVLILQHILHKNHNLKKITVRFLQPGHTYLPNDSEFGDVECALKSQSRLYTADDYINVMKNCRRRNKFIITRLQKEDFYSVAPLLERITNRKVDSEKQKISWLATFEIEIRKDSALQLFMKSKIDEVCKIVDISKGAKTRKVKPNFDMDLPMLYPDGRELSSAKVKDLKEMMKLIPADAKPFYNFLRNIRSGEFVDDADGFGNTIDFEVEFDDDESEI